MPWVLDNTVWYVVAAAIIILFLYSGIRVLREYERGVVFQLGRFWREGAGPGPPDPDRQQMVRVDLRTVVLDVPSQDVITRDNVSVKVNAVVYFRVVDPEQGDHPGRELPRGHQPARADDAALGARQARARRDAGRAREAQPRHPADPRRADRRLGHQGRQRRDQARRPRRDHGPRDRAPGRGRARAARQGDPRRRRAAGGARSWSQAAEMLAPQPQAMQLRYLQTLQEIAGDKNSTIVFPLPMDLLHNLQTLAKSKT